MSLWTFEAWTLAAAAEGGTMTIAEYCIEMWFVCVAFVLANVTDSAAEARESIALRRKMLRMRSRDRAFSLTRSAMMSRAPAKASSADATPFSSFM